MIEWIALVVAADAECKVSSALNRSNKALRRSTELGGDPFVIIHSFELDELPAKGGFLKEIFFPTRLVIRKKPKSKFSVRISDIRDVTQHFDSTGNPYVELDIINYNPVYIRGTLEQVARILNGVKHGK